jgi:hypothetical protein
MNSSGLLADSSNQGNALIQDMMDAAGCFDVDDLPTANRVTSLTPGNVAFTLQGTTFLPDRYWDGAVSHGVLTGAGGDLPLLAVGAGDFVSAGGGLIVVLRCNTGRNIPGAGINVQIKTVWQMMPFPSSGPLGSITPETCGIAGVYTVNTGFGPADRGPAGEVNNWPPETNISFSGSHPIVNGPYGAAASFTLRAGEWARMTGAGAVPIGTIENPVAREVGGGDLGDAIAPVIAVEKGLGRIVVICAQDLIAKPATGGGFGGPFVPAVYQGSTLLKNAIAWVTRRSHLPPHPVYNP